MSEVVLAEFSTKRRFPDMPYEVLFETFRRLPKGKLIKISRLCSTFRDVAGDTCLWKDVYIDYEPHVFKPRNEVIAFEELYSEPWPVNVIDISHRHINAPVSSNIGQVVKVNKLRLASIEANNVAFEAILAKYQFTELYLDYNMFGHHDHIIGTNPKAFSKQTSLRVLSLKSMNSKGVEYRSHLKRWLAQVLRNCKNLKTLDLSGICLTSREMFDFAKNLPISLEKLLIQYYFGGERFLRLLAEKTINLRELEFGPTKSDLKFILSSPSLLKFQFLESLRIHLHIGYQYNIELVTELITELITELYTYIIKLPALKTINVIVPHQHDLLNYLETRFEEFGTMLEPHGITVRVIERPEWPVPEDSNLWKVQYKC